MVAMHAWVNRLPALTELVLVLLAAWFVAGLVLPETETSDPVANVSNAGQRQESADIHLIMDTPLFGEAKMSAPNPENRPKVVTQSRLNVKLIGTVVASERSAAIVVMNRGVEQQLFFIGDTMQPGVRLQEVEAGAIVVDHGGKLERIEIEEGSSLEGPATLQPSSSPNLFSVPQSRRVSRPMLDQQLENFPQLLTQARVLPRMINGKADGFTITQIVPGSLYEKVGLHNGDIIRKVNGQDISGPQQAMAMFQELKDATSISVEIERGGSVQVVNYDIR